MSSIAIDEVELRLSPVEVYLAAHPDQTADNFFAGLGGDQVKYEVAAARINQEIGTPVSDEALALHAIWRALKARDAQVSQAE